MAKKLVSVIILNYNGKDLLKKVIESSLKLSVSKKYSKGFTQPIEVILLDNASTDNSVKFVKSIYPKVKVIHLKKNLGYPAFNKAVKKSSGKYLLLLNNDMELKSNCLNPLLKSMGGDVAMTSPKLINFFKRNQIDSSGSWLSRSFYSGHSRSGKDIKREITHSGVGLIDKSAIKQLGYLFDPDYFLYGEDVDLGLRLRLIGKKTIYIPDSIMYHMESVTTKKVHTRPQLTFLMERNLLLTFLKVFTIKTILVLSPYVFGMRMLAIIRDLIHLDIKNMSARLSALVWIIIHPRLILQKRHEIQEKRTVKDNFLLSIFTEKYILKIK